MLKAVTKLQVKVQNYVQRQGFHIANKKKITHRHISNVNRLILDISIFYTWLQPSEI